MIVEVCRMCYVRIEKSGNTYRIDVVTDSHEITIACNKLAIDDRRPKPVVPLTNFMETISSEEASNTGG